MPSGPHVRRVLMSPTKGTDMRDLLPHFNNVLTLINLLAEDAAEQQSIALEYNRAWAYGDYAAAEYLGNKLAELGRRHVEKGL
jgi:hypothetical protein